MSDDHEIIMRVLKEMFQADSDYGCGFYGDQRWRKAYKQLQILSGFKGETSVLDTSDD